eukprot:gene6285-12729_t
MLKFFKHQQRLKQVIQVRFNGTSAKVPSPPNKSSPNFLLISGASIIGLGFLVYKMESEPEFQAGVQSRIPFLATILEPLQKPLRLTGLIPRREISSPPVIEGSQTVDVSIESHETTEVESNISDNSAEIGDVVEVAVDTVDVEDNTDIIISSNNIPVDHTPDDVVPVEQSIEEQAVHVATTSPSTNTEKNLTTSTATQSEPSKHLTEPPMMDIVLPADLSQASAADLRVRVTQLTSELVDRTKWEAVRIQQTIKQMETELSHQYIEMMAQQRLEAKLDLERALFEKERAIREEMTKTVQETQSQLDQRLQDTLRAQAEGFSSSLKEELRVQAEKLQHDAEEDANLQLALVKEDHVRRSMPIVKDLESTRSELAVFKSIVDDIAVRKEQSHRSHMISAATMALGQALEASTPISTELAVLKQSAAGDELVSQVLASFPTLASSQGIPTRAELSAHFAVVRGEMRKAALAPEAAPAFVSQVVGNVLAAISWVPHGFVAGDGPEEILSRVAFLVEFGDFSGALREMEGIRGHARSVSVSQEWEKATRSRLEADQALKIIKAAAALRHLELSN